LISWLADHKLQFLVALLLAIGTIIAGIGLMSTSGYLISRAAQRPMIVDLFMITAGVRFFGISRAVIRYFERVVSHDLTFRILHSMRTHLYRLFDTFSQKWLMGQRPGNLLQGIVNDVETLQNVYLRIISPVLVAVVISIITFTGLAFFDLRIAFAALFFFLVNGIIIPLLATRLAKGRGKTEVTARTRLKEFLVDRLQGLQDLLWLGKKKCSQEEFQSIQATLDNIQYRNASTNGLTEGLNNLMAHLAMFSVLVLALPMVASGAIKGVWLAALTLGVLSSFEAFQGLANAFIQYETSLEASSRLHKLEESGEPESASGQIHISLPTTTPVELAFHDVSFSYGEENITLERISLTILPGSKTAIVGPTGSGKSTLANLILGFWHPEKGMVTAGGQNIHELETGSYRGRFGVVAQDSYIFNRSLRENLLLAKPDASDHELREAMNKAGLGQFALDLDREPGNLGMRLSGGERQLLAMAMALLKKPSVWIFDEPTANMDVKTERNTLNTIWSETGKDTLILITHRLLDMERMDKIIVMLKGEIAEIGTHKELISTNRVYAKMFEQQNQVIRE